MDNMKLFDTVDKSAEGVILKFNWRNGDSTILYGESERVIYQSKELQDKRFYDLESIERLEALPLELKLVRDTDDKHPIHFPTFADPIRLVAQQGVGVTVSVTYAQKVRKFTVRSIGPDFIEVSMESEN
jgi:hypothetical protein